MEEAGSERWSSNFTEGSARRKVEASGEVMEWPAGYPLPEIGDELSTAARSVDQSRFAPAELDAWRQGPVRTHAEPKNAVVGADYAREAPSERRSARRMFALAHYLELLMEATAPRRRRKGGPRAITCLRRRRRSTRLRRTRRGRSRGREASLSVEAAVYGARFPSGALRVELPAG